MAINNILAIETSCDETAVAIVSSNKTILANEIFSQIRDHQPFGGVVPELASRKHVDNIEHVIELALDKSGLELRAIDAIAATAGPGLIGGVLVGVMVAKSMAASLNKPFIPVNHLHGHALTIRLISDIEFPYLLLLVSGGHCQIVEVKSPIDYFPIGSTIDDALGEAFDKVAKMLGLTYPGGPIVESMAKNGDSKRFAFPRSMVGRDNCDFSFSGLKTAVSREISKIANLTDQDKSDICASFQVTIVDILQDRLQRAFAMVPHIKNIVVAGGVAANMFIKDHLTKLMGDHEKTLFVPQVALCTDNAAMIAWAAHEYVLLPDYSLEQLDFAPRSRWPLCGV